MQDPYCYKGTSIIRNKLGIKNQYELSELENAIVYKRLIDIDKKTNNKYNDFSIQRLQAIHKYLFEPIYEWAGKFRTINIEKPEKVLNGLSVQYSDKGLVLQDAEKVIQNINNINWNKLSLDTKVKEFSKSFAQLWKAHPFREGNSRTTLTFVSQFATEHGFPLNKQLFQLHTGYYRNALVMSSIGEYSEPKYLENIIRDAMIEGAKEKSKDRNTNSIEKYCEKTSHNKSNILKENDIEIGR